MSIPGSMTCSELCLQCIWREDSGWCILRKCYPARRCKLYMPAKTWKDAADGYEHRSGFTLSQMATDDIEDLVKLLGAFVEAYKRSQKEREQ